MYYCIVLGEKNKRNRAFFCTILTYLKSKDLQFAGSKLCDTCYLALWTSATQMIAQVTYHWAADRYIPLGEGKRRKKKFLNCRKESLSKYQPVCLWQAARCQGGNLRKAPQTPSTVISPHEQRLSVAHILCGELHQLPSRQMVMTRRCLGIPTATDNLHKVRKQYHRQLRDTSFFF